MAVWEKVQLGQQAQLIRQPRSLVKPAWTGWEYTNDALDTLVDVMKSAQSDSARIAATAILDRGYGRPTKTISLEVKSPFVPTIIELVAYTGPA